MGSEKLTKAPDVYSPARMHNIVQSYIWDGYARRDAVSLAEELAQTLGERALAIREAGRAALREATDE